MAGCKGRKIRSKNASLDNRESVKHLLKKGLVVLKSIINKTFINI